MHFNTVMRFQPFLINVGKAKPSNWRTQGLAHFTKPRPRPIVAKRSSKWSTNLGLSLCMEELEKSAGAMAGQLVTHPGLASRLPRETLRAEYGQWDNWDPGGGL